MTGSDWKHPHIVVLTAATLIAFGGDYALDGRRSLPAPVGPVIIGNEVTAAPRTRPDENALIAENAEREDSVNRARPEPPAPRPEPRAEPRPPARDTADDRDFVEPGLEGEAPGGKPQDDSRGD